MTHHGYTLEADNEVLVLLDPNADLATTSAKITLAVGAGVKAADEITITTAGTGCTKGPLQGGKITFTCPGLVNPSAPSANSFSFAATSAASPLLKGARCSRCSCVVKRVRGCPCLADTLFLSAPALLYPPTKKKQ